MIVLGDLLTERLDLADSLFRVRHDLAPVKVMLTAMTTSNARGMPIRAAFPEKVSSCSRDKSCVSKASEGSHPIWSRSDDNDESIEFVRTAATEYVLRGLREDLPGSSNAGHQLITAETFDSQISVCRPCPGTDSIRMITRSGVDAEKCSLHAPREVWRLAQARAGIRRSVYVQVVEVAKTSDERPTSAVHTLSI